MLVSELASTPSAWFFLGEGSYNMAFLSERSHTINGYTGRWVLKKAKSSVSYLSSIKRSVRLWNILNPKYPAFPVRDGWLAPYLGNEVASDDEVAEKIIEIYRQHRIILVDAYVSSNFLKYKGDTVVIDMDYAIRRGSLSMDICIDDKVFYSRILHRLEKERVRRPKSTSVIHTLLYLDKHDLREAVKDEHITPELIRLLRLFRIVKKPIVPNTLNFLLRFIKTKSLTEIIPAELFRFVDEYDTVKMALHHAIDVNDSGMLRRLFAQSAPGDTHVPMILEDGNERGLKPIVLAAEDRCWDLVITIADRYSTDAEDKKEYARALLYAVQHNQMRAVQSLIAAKTFEWRAGGGWYITETSNGFLHYAVQASHAPILQELTQENLITKPAVNNEFFHKNKEGLTPFMLALKTNPIAIISLMNYIKLLESRTKLQIFLAAGEDLIRVAQSNESVFRVLLKHTATMNYLDHEQLYNASWLQKDLGLYQFIYENRIQCLIYGLLDGPNKLIDYDKIAHVQTMRIMFDDFMRTSKSAQDLAFVYNNFTPILSALTKPRMRLHGLLFLDLTPQTEAEKMLSKLAETIAKLAPLLPPLESELSGPLQSDALVDKAQSQIVFR